MKNALIRAFVPKKEPGTEIGKRILIVSTTALGDTLWATPAIRSLKKKGHDIAILTSPIGAQVLKNNPHIDTLIIAKKSLGFQSLSLIKKLRSLDIDSVLFFHVSQRLIFPLALSVKPTYSISTKGSNKGLDSLFSELIEMKAKQHAIVRRMRLAKCTGDERLELFFSDDEINAASKWLREDQKIVVLHVGSKDRFKRWPLSFFSQVAKKLQEDGFDIALTGSADERAMTEEIQNDIPGVINLAGEACLREQMALISKCDLMITNDTGPMHVAFAFDRPTVALFSVTDPEECGPHLAENVITFRAPTVCTPCLKKRCLDPFCMRAITPEMVYGATQQLMENRCKNSNI